MRTFLKMIGAGIVLHSTLKTWMNLVTTHCRQAGSKLLNNIEQLASCRSTVLLLCEEGVGMGINFNYSFTDSRNLAVYVGTNIDSPICKNAGIF